MTNLKNQKSKQKFCNGGFSLLELLVYIAVLSIAITILVGVFFSVNRSRGKVESQSEVNSNLRFSLERISQDIKSASEISIPGTAGDVSNNLVVTSASSIIEYCVSDNLLRRQENGTCNNTSPAITSNEVRVENLSFGRIENSNANLSKKVISIEVNITASYNATNPDWQYSASKKTTFSQKQW